MSAVAEGDRSLILRISLIRGKKMKKTKNNKIKLTASIAIVFLIISAFAIIINGPVQAQSADEQFTGELPSGIIPDSTITTEAYLSVRPNPVGQGQTILVNIWLHPPINVQRQFLAAYEVVFTKPSGEEFVFGPMDSYKGDSTAWFEYPVDELGEWTVRFDFLGTYFPEAAVPAGPFAPATTLGSVYYKPSHTRDVKLEVQEEQVISWPPAALPTDYWTRPVYPTNREWWSILGSYPATGVVGGDPDWPANTNKYMSNYDFIPYVEGPDSPHIVWKREYTLGGLIGGPAGTHTWSQPEDTIAAYPNIIYDGRAYDTYAKPGTGTSAQTYWRCYDIRTGEVYWEQPATTTTSEPFPGFVITSVLAPTIVEYALQGQEVPGATARSAVTVYLDAISGGRLIKWNPWTGAIEVNVTGPPSRVSSGDFYANPYVLSVQNLGGGNYRLINWTIENNAGDWATYSESQAVVDDFDARVKGNITWPFSSLGTVDYESGIAVVTSGISSPDTGTNIGYRIMAARITNGELLWNTTTDTSTGLETFFSAGIGLADHGKFAGRMQNGQWYCWDLESGDIVWKSELSSWPWGVFGAYSSVSAYGYIYSYDYAGVHAINWENGKIDWDFIAPTPYAYETPYTSDGTSVYSWHGAAKAADGKLYVYTSEHTPGHPVTRGWKLFALDAISGKQIWNITTGQLILNTIWFGLGGIPGSRTFQGAVADGYLAMTNEYDGYLYVYGKGTSKTTVTAPDVEVPKGTAIMIKGTVLDTSPAQPDTPCVSKDSMTLQMEYLHNQQPIAGVKGDGVITGVPVTLTAITPDGSCIDFGTATTEGYYGTFGFEWTPPDEGTYEIIASFAGDDSYGSSGASTYITVGPAPAAEVTPEPTTEEPVHPMFSTEALIVIGVIAIAAIAIIAYLVMRKPNK
jgi:hypothetical protein